MTLKTRIQSQRDARWGSILLGYNSIQPYTIYNYGCLITCLANYIDKQPDEVNTLLKNAGGFATGSGNFIWGKSTELGLTQTYISPRCQAIPLYGTEVSKLREFIKQGLPALCEVDFNPADVEEQMHFVLAVGFTDTEIIVVDPWEGQIETWSDATFQRNTYQYRVYDKKITSGSIETLPVEKEVFENLVRKSTIYDKVRGKLNVEDNETVILSELDKLIGYEDAVVSKDNQLQDAGKQIAELKTNLQTLNDSHNALQTSYNDLQGQLQKDTDTIADLRKDISDLEKQITMPVFRGWKKALLDLISKL